MGDKQEAATARGEKAVKKELLDLLQGTQVVFFFGGFYYFSTYLPHLAISILTIIFGRPNLLFEIF